MISDNLRKIIKKYFISDNARRNQKILKNLPEIESTLLKLLKEYPEYESTLKIIKLALNDVDLRKCENCGKYLPYSKKKQRFCGTKCANSSNDVKLKIKETLLERYGVDATIKNPISNLKRQQTLLEKYGALETFKSSIIRDKIVKTNLQKYGYVSPLSSQIVKDKRKNTFISRYGVEHQSYLPHVKEKLKNNLNSSRQNSLNRSYDDAYEGLIRYEKYVIPLFTRNEYFGEKGHEYNWKCQLCRK